MNNLSQFLQPTEWTLTLPDVPADEAYAVLTCFSESPGRMILSYIYVAKERRHQKAGTRLFDKALAFSQAHQADYLECIPLSTPEAQSFWEKQCKTRNGAAIGPVCMFPLTWWGTLQKWMWQIRYPCRYIWL